MTILYYGDGKGKTTAALGIAVRSAGIKNKVLIIQFIKSQKSSEYNILKSIKNIQIKVGGKGFYKVMGDKQPKDIHLKAAYQALDDTKQAFLYGKWDTVILDEILDLIQWKLVSEKTIIDLIKSKPEKIDLVITGHKASKKIIKLCDIVTEMKKIKHIFDKGVKAQRGIDC